MGYAPTDKRFEPAIAADQQIRERDAGFGGPAHALPRHRLHRRHQVRDYPPAIDYTSGAGLDKGQAMSEDSTTPDPVELARRFFAAVNRRDVDAVESFYAPDAVLRSAEIGTLAGPAAIRSFFEDILSRYDEFHGELEEITDLGNGVGFLVTVCRGRP